MVFYPGEGHDYVGNINWIEFEKVGATDPSAPIRIEAEDYLRGWGVDPEATSDTGGGSNIGWINEGDVVTYSVDVPKTDKYTVAIRVASKKSGGKIIVDELLGGEQVELDIPNTGGWQNWETIDKIIQLEEGKNEISLSFEGSGFVTNINWLEFTLIPTISLIR